MKLEATKFRPRDVVRHILQTHATPLHKILALEGNVTDDILSELCNTCILIR